MLFSLACYAANITSERVDRMSVEAREWLRISTGLSVEQFRAACLFLAAYRKRYRDSLRVLHAGYECVVLGEPGAARLQ